jgi:SAM-dependent methyltransferase
MMVGAHPRIAVPFSVTGMWYRYGRMLDRYNGLQTTEDLERMVDDLLQEERIRLWDVGLDRNEVLEGLQPGSYPGLIARFHDLYARQKGKDLWGNIDISTLDDMDMANAWFPAARFVHIVRDGRDVALSHRTMPYGASNIGECAEQWVQRLHVNMKMGAILGARRYLIVRYEDIVLDSEAALRRLCDFLEVDYATQMLDYPKMVDGKIPESRRWLWPDISKPPVPSNVYRWKTAMGPVRRIVFERTANAMLKRLGYEAFPKVPKRASAYALELWYFLGRGHRLRRFAAKLGIRRSTKLERGWKGGSRMGESRRDYRDVQAQAFRALVQEGEYSPDFEHLPHAKAFFADSMRSVVETLPASNGLSILECGCGNGAWLDFMQKTVCGGRNTADRYYGFDVTSDMIEVARTKLGGRVQPDHLHQGDILDDESYVFDDPGQRFGIIYAYDVIQQLPRRLQMKGCEAMLRRLAPSGAVVVFDQDCHSRHGMKMGAKKLATKYLKLGLVPDYYCNARYPPLTRFARRIANSGPYSTEVRVAPNGKRRALIVRKAAADTGPRDG